MWAAILLRLAITATLQRNRPSNGADGNNLSGDVQLRTIYEFLLGIGYRGVGDLANAKTNLLRVVATSRENDLGKAATELLQNP
jgi:hypothetical protein